MAGQIGKSLILRQLARTALQRQNPRCSVKRFICTSAVLNQNNLRKQQENNFTKINISSIMEDSDTSRSTFLERNIDSLSLYMSTKKSFDEVLGFVAGKILSVDEAVIILRRLFQIAETEKWNPTRVNEDRRIQQISEVLDKNLTSLSPNLMIQQVQYIQRLYPKNHPLMKAAESQVLVLVKKLPMSQLYKLIQTYESQKHSHTGEKIYNEAWKLLQTRWVEIDNPKLLVSIMYAAEKSCPEFMLKLEERALDLVSQMNLKDLYRVFYQVSKSHSRNTPLLRALAHHLNKTPLNLSLIQLSNLLFACAVMNFYDEKLIGKICQIVHNSKSELDANKPICSSILKSLSTLRYCHPDSLSTISSVLLSDIKSVPEPDIVCLLLTCVNLDNVPQTLEANLRNIVEKLSPLKDSDPPLWLDTVWSLVMLKKAGKDVVSTVLNQSNIDKLRLYETPVKIAWQLKLINICMAAEYEIQDYDLKIPQNLQICKNIEDATLSPPAPDSSFQLQVYKALESVAPADRYQKRNVVINPCIRIDVEICLNSNGKPVPVNIKKSVEDLKVALQILDFKDMTLGVTKATGPQAFVSRYLGYLGYKVVEVPYTEMKALKTQVEKVQYIESKLKNLVK